VKSTENDEAFDMAEELLNVVDDLLYDKQVSIKEIMDLSKDYPKAVNRKIGMIPDE